MPIIEPGDLPLLTDAEVQAHALPGESWHEARERLYCESITPVPSNASMRTKRPEYLSHRSPGVRLDQLDALRAFQALSPAEQVRAHGGHRGASDLLECPSLAAIVALGLEWTACTARLPFEDTRARLRYLVSVDYDHWLTCCRYTSWGWARVSDTSLVSGVTHWRVAQDQERVSRVATRAEVRTLRELRNA